MAIIGKPIGRKVIDYGGTSNALQEAVKLKLENALIKCFDGNNRKPVYPFVILGEVLNSPFNSKGIRGTYANMTLNLWSDEAGSLEAKGLTDMIIDLLTYAPLQLRSGYKVVTSKLDHARIIPADNSATNISRSMIYLDFVIVETGECNI